MADDPSFTRPYVTENGELVYLTDSQFVERQKHSPVRKLRAGEVLMPEVTPVTQVAPDPMTTTRQAADTVVRSPEQYPVPEMRERENL